MNKAFPLRPVAALTALVQVPQVVSSHGSGGSRDDAAAAKSGSSITGWIGSRATCHHSAISSSRDRLGRTALQKTSSTPAKPLAASLDADSLERGRVKHAGVEALQFFRIELGGAARHLRHVEFGHQFSQRQPGFDGVGGAELGQQAVDRHGLHALVIAQVGDADAAEPLGQGGARRVAQQRKMGECRHRAVERLPKLDLHRRIGDMVLTPDHVGDAEFDIVHDRRQGIEDAAVLPDQDGVAEVAAMEVLMTAHQIVPFNGIVPQQEPPVRFAPLRLQARPVVVGQLQRGAIVDRRQAAPQQALALQRQLFRRLVAGIKPAIALQRFLRQFVAVEPVGLAGEAVPVKAEPAQIPLDPGGELRRRTFQIGIVQAQQEAAVLERANSQLISARRMLPTWSIPVGLGAKRTATLMGLGSWGCNVFRKPGPDG